jgi:CheY-like chemotaxis protein/anti-sigma regulatory factor (Ser/Thr protein kinase)
VPATLETTLASLAHEIRTPLNGILAFSELLIASALPERERGWANAIKSAAEHLVQLTTLIIDGAKAGQDAFVPRDEVFDPKALAEAAAASLRARAEAKGLAADVTIGALPSNAIGDVVRLRAALENLIDNAVKFTERGRVALRVAAEPQSGGSIILTFTVEDSGIGFTPVEMEQLFRPFKQANKDIARRFGGAGLGLALVKRMIEAMGGDLTVESTPGRGSAFRLTAVVTPAETAERPPRAQAAEPIATTSRRLRILCAEDSPYARIVLNAILKELGHEVEFVGNGEAAVEAVVRGGCDLVLMDITLPGLDGIAATQRIRALAGDAGRVPIVGLSARNDPDEERLARSCGMDAFLGKPVSPAALDAVLRSFSV